MKYFLILMIGLIFQLSDTYASAERLKNDYADIAIAIVDGRIIEKLIIIKGDNFSMENLNDEALGHAITHPRITNKRHVCLLLKNRLRSDIATSRVIWWNDEIMKLKDYGEIAMTDLLKLSKSYNNSELSKDVINPLAFPFETRPPNR